MSESHVELMWKQLPLHAKSIGMVLTSAECEVVMRDALATGMSRALVVGKGGVKLADPVRTSDQAVLPRTPEREWLYERLLGKTELVNQECWRFTLSGIQDVRVLRYRPRQHYDWHFDTYPGSLRKLTCVISLTAPESYRCGRLEVRGKHDGKAISKLQGSGTWFPTYLRHRATAPEFGERWVLVTWLTGPAWQ